MGLNVLYQFILFGEWNENAVVWDGNAESWKEGAVIVAPIFQNFTPFPLLLSLQPSNIQHEYAYILMTSIIIVQIERETGVQLSM